MSYTTQKQTYGRGTYSRKGSGIGYRRTEAPALRKRESGCCGRGCRPCIMDIPFF